MVHYPLETPGGHLVMRYDGQALLLDTGLPFSVGNRASSRFFGREVPLLKSYNGMTVEQWSESVGVDLDVLVGSDVLSRYAVTIDGAASRIVLEASPPSGARTAPLETVAGLPVVEVELAGRRLRMLFHTGATLSCLRDVDTRGHRSIGVARDCYPGLGEFGTELRLVRLMFGDQPVTLECGLMPAALERALRPVDVHGIVGTNLLEKFIVGWAPDFSELRLEARRTTTTPVRVACLETQQPIRLTS